MPKHQGTRDSITLGGGLPARISQPAYLATICKLSLAFLCTPLTFFWDTFHPISPSCSGVQAWDGMPTDFVFGIRWALNGFCRFSFLISGHYLHCLLTETRVNRQWDNVLLLLYKSSACRLYVSQTAAVTTAFKHVGLTHEIHLLLFLDTWVGDGLWLPLTLLETQCVGRPCLLHYFPYTPQFWSLTLAFWPFTE